MLYKEFVPYEPSLDMKELGFDEPCFGEYRQWDGNEPWLQLYQNLVDCSTDPADYEYTQEALAPTFSQAINFLYIYSNKQIDIELKASDTYEERVRKINQGCEDLRNLQNNKSN